MTPQAPTPTPAQIKRWRKYLADEIAEGAVYRELANKRTGEEELIPEGIDPGWNYNPGISRSAAVSKFIAQIYNLEFPEGYSLYNRHVYSTLLRVHGSSLYGEGPLNPKELPGYQLK